MLRGGDAADGADGTDGADGGKLKWKLSDDADEATEEVGDWTLGDDAAWLAGGDEVGGVSGIFNDSGSTGGDKWPTPKYPPGSRLHNGDGKAPGCGNPEAGCGRSVGGAKP